MRYAFIKTLTKLASKNQKIFLLTGDLGYTVFEDFATAFPKRFINMGVAESNMVGVAAGLSLEGFIPFVYSIATFATMRPYEQIRNDICLQNLNVKIVGVGGGLGYGHAGPTHHSQEDIAIMRVLPNITIVCPADPFEVEVATEQAAKLKGPVYLRLGKAGEPKIHPKKPKLKLGKGIIMRDGSDVLLLATGNQVINSLLVAEVLSKKGIAAKVINLHTIKPLDKELILDSVKKIKYVVTIEEHSVIGGLGSAVAEVLASEEGNTVLKRIGIADKFSKIVGDHEHLRNHHSLTPEKIKKIVLNLIK